MACAALLGVNAHATLTLSDSNDLGTIVPDAPSGEAQELGYVNTLLGLSLNEVKIVGGAPDINTITRSNVADPGFGSVTTQFKYESEKGNLTIVDNKFVLPTGYEYVLAKYGQGQSPSRIAYVWYVGGQAASIPGESLSHVVGYNYSDDPSIIAVPEPSTYMAGALLLLPFAAGAVRSYRRNRATK